MNRMTLAGTDSYHEHVRGYGMSLASSFQDDARDTFWRFDEELDRHSMADVIFEYGSAFVIYNCEPPFLELATPYNMLTHAESSVLACLSGVYTVELMPLNARPLFTTGYFWATQFKIVYCGASYNCLRRR